MLFARGDGEHKSIISTVVDLSKFFVFFWKWFVCMCTIGWRSMIYVKLDTSRLQTKIFVQTRNVSVSLLIFFPSKLHCKCFSYKMYFVRFWNVIPLDLKCIVSRCAIHVHFHYSRCKIAYVIWLLTSQWEAWYIQLIKTIHLILPLWKKLFSTLSQFLIS